MKKDIAIDEKKDEKINNSKQVKKKNALKKTIKIKEIKIKVRKKKKESLIDDKNVKSIKNEKIEPEFPIKNDNIISGEIKNNTSKQENEKSGWWSK